MGISESTPSHSSACCVVAACAAAVARAQHDIEEEGKIKREKHKEDIK